MNKPLNPSAAHACHAAVQKERAVTERAAALAADWAALRPQTLAKAALTAQDFRALAEYLCSYNPLSRCYEHTARQRAALPLKLATVRPETRAAALKEAEAAGARRQGVTMAGENCPAELAAIAADLDAIGALLWQTKPTQIHWDSGVFTAPKFPPWHSDRNFYQGAPAIIGRINLPPEFMDDRGRAQIADDNAFYLIATKRSEDGETVEGTLHRSSRGPYPSPSVFMKAEPA